MPDLITIGGYPPPLSWDITVSAKADISTLRCRFEGELGSNLKPQVSYAGLPFPYGDGRFQLGPVDTDRIRSSDHPQGTLEVHDANLYAGTVPGRNRFAGFMVSLEQAIETAVGRSPSYSEWQGILAQSRAEPEDKPTLAKTISAALADATDWDRALRRLFSDFHTLVPEGDPSHIVCVADEPASPTFIHRVLSLRWRRNYAEGETLLHVRYLHDGEERSLAIGSGSGRARRVGGLQYDAQSAVLEGRLQLLKIKAAHLQATATVPLPETAGELASLMPGQGLVIDGAAYWIVQVDMNSQSDELSLELQQPPGRAEVDPAPTPDPAPTDGDRRLETPGIRVFTIGRSRAITVRVFTVANADRYRVRHWVASASRDTAVEEIIPVPLQLERPFFDHTVVNLMAQVNYQIEVTALDSTRQYRESFNASAFATPNS